MIRRFVTEARRRPVFTMLSLAVGAAGGLLLPVGWMITASAVALGSALWVQRIGDPIPVARRLRP